MELVTKKSELIRFAPSLRYNQTTLEGKEVNTRITRVAGKALKPALPSRYFFKAPLYAEIAIGVVTWFSWLVYSLYIAAPLVVVGEHQLVTWAGQTEYCSDLLNCSSKIMSRWLFWFYMLQVAPFATAFIIALAQEGHLDPPGSVTT